MLEAASEGGRGILEPGRKESGNEVAQRQPPPAYLGFRLREGRVCMWPVSAAQARRREALSNQTILGVVRHRTVHEHGKAYFVS